MNAIGDAPTAFPLCWPSDRPRSENRERARFRLTFWGALQDLRKELRHFHVSDVVVSTNLPLKRDGMPMAIRGQIDDPGVALWFRRKGMLLCVSCDRWTLPEDNLRAVGLTVGNIRANERYGTAWMVDAALSGFAALPAGSSAQGWWEVLRVAPDATLEQVYGAYRALAMKHHPDKGGDAETFRQITEAFEAGKGVRG